jgi:hypothetical protein
MMLPEMEFIALLMLLCSVAIVAVPIAYMFVVMVFTAIQVSARMLWEWLWA